MSAFTQRLSLRWSDLDPNFHLRHSVYYDFGAQARIQVLNEVGITAQVMQEQHFGPILFREECIFRKEIRFDDVIVIDTKLSKLRNDFARWSFRHTLVRQSDNELCATLLLDGAWMDTKLRKLSVPPAIAVEALSKFPRTEDFVMTEVVAK